MKAFKWLGRNIYYFSFAVVLLLTSLVFAAAGNNFSFIGTLGAKQNDSPQIITQNTPVVQATQTTNNPPDVNAEQNYYIDENGNWIAGNPPPTVVVPKTSSWCGQKVPIKQQSGRCEDISCPTLKRSPRIDWYNPCDACNSGMARLVCAHSQHRYHRD